MADQTSAGFHSYAKPRKRTGDDENRRPSFLQLHGYAAQRKRDRGSPTGHTPHSKSKRPSRPALSEMGQLQKEAKKKWTNEESQFLNGKANTTLLHTITFWKKCAADLNEEFGTSRSDVSCRLQYMRLKKEGSASLDTGIQEIEYPKTADKASQTDLTVPVLRQQANFNEWEKDDSGPKEKAETMSHGSKILLTSLQGMKDKHNIDELSFNEVLNTLLSSNDLIDLTRSIYDVKSLRENLWKMFLEDICESARCMCEKRKSVLYHKDYLSLKTFEWRYILEEMVGENKRLTEVLLSVSMPKRKATISHAEKLVKTLGFVYGVLMKCRWKDLSLIQRLVSMVMFDEKVHQKVFDRLQPLGICVSHSVTTNVVDTISGYFNAELIDCIKEKKKFRIIGDNVNFSVDVSHLRSSQKKHMEHWFGSAALIQNLSFGHLSQDVPQQNLLQVGWETFLPNEKDWTRVRNDYAILIMRVLVQHVEVFKPLSKVLPQNLSEPYSEVNMKKTTKVIPLPVVAKNEQRYSDVIDVLDSYEQAGKAGKQMADDFTVHIGGDQLTRERFSGAKRLRGMGALLQNRFQHLSPITFEFFHLQMSLLSIIYKCLYNDKSTETGTLGAERTRLGRSRADGKNVKNHYEDCKELAISVIDMYILEAACHFFGLTKLDDIPTHSVVDFEEMSQKDQLSWIHTTVGKMVDTLVWPYGFEAVQSIVEPKPSYSKVTIVMPNGQVTELLIPSNVIKTAPSIDDGMKTYAHNILELGLLYKDLTDSTKCPDRERMIPILKLTMLVCKGKSTKSKYALEILRFLCHQFATLSEQIAHESFFGCFVNTGGKVDTHIPADMAMEHMVRRIKDHIRTLQSNKAESTIRKRTAAFAGLESICDKFDHETSVIVRAQKHKTPSSSSDERILFQNLHRLKPFEHQADRKVMSHPRLSSSILNNLTRHQLQSWINGHKVNLTGEIGK